MSPRWIRVDHITVSLYYLTSDDECYYAREYISRGGYQASDTNQLIHNFKKPPERRTRPEWKYKVEAISRFARELADMLPEAAFITGIPSSKCDDDAEYDDRLEQVLAEVSQLRPDIRYERLLRIQQSAGPSHLGGTRNPDTLHANLRWCGGTAEEPIVYLIDDVIGSGGHFCACKRVLMEHWPHCSVIGVFWARATDG